MPHVILFEGADKGSDHCCAVIARRTEQRGVRRRVRPSSGVLALMEAGQSLLHRETNALHDPLTRVVDVDEGRGAVQTGS